jgi:hypothetical protein
MLTAKRLLIVGATIAIAASLTACGGATATTTKTTTPVASSTAPLTEGATFVARAKTLDFGNKDLAGSPDADVSALGSTVCDALTSATTVEEVDMVIGGLVNSDAHPTVEEASTFVEAAATYLCTEAAALTHRATAEPVTTAAPATTKPKPAPAAEFGEGTYKVGTDIKPGLYKATVTSGMGYWARLADPDGNNILANDVKASGTMYLRVRSSDRYIEISGATFHKVG